jgi:RHS repeat-associated protein
VVWGAGYAAFGLAQIDPLSTVENNLRFPGQYFDAETGLHYNFQRTYDPEAGRYTQVDPIGFAGGGNHFGYVQNNPSSLLDPFGLKPIIDIGGRLGHLVGQVSIYLGQKSRAR